MNDEPQATEKAVGAATVPERPAPLQTAGSSTTEILNGDMDLDAMEAANVLVAHLFAQGDRNVPGISYAVAYRLATVHSGGDIVDVYQFNNDSVALSIADISGKGPQAAVHAALIKYGLRAYSSHGLTAEKAMRAMDRLYLENSTFENAESFATVFLGIVDRRRRSMTYTCAGHEPVLLVHPHQPVRLLGPTAPIIGVFDDQSHLFSEEHVELWPGSLLIAATDGITEAQNESRELYGIDRLIEVVERERESEPKAIVDAILESAYDFCAGIWRDDIAILVARFHA